MLVYQAFAQFEGHPTDAFEPVFEQKAGIDSNFHWIDKFCYFRNFSAKRLNKNISIFSPAK